jgi:hypothetical protein
MMKSLIVAVLTAFLAVSAVAPAQAGFIVSE